MITSDLNLYKAFASFAPVPSILSAHNNAELCVTPLQVQWFQQLAAEAATQIHVSADGQLVLPAGLQVTTSQRQQEWQQQQASDAAEQQSQQFSLLLATLLAKLSQQHAGVCNYLLQVLLPQLLHCEHNAADSNMHLSAASHTGSTSSSWVSVLCKTAADLHLQDNPSAQQLAATCVQQLEQSLSDVQSTPHAAGYMSVGQQAHVQLLAVLLQSSSRHQADAQSSGGTAAKATHQQGSAAAAAAMDASAGRGLQPELLQKLLDCVVHKVALGKGRTWAEQPRDSTVIQRCSAWVDQSCLTSPHCQALCKLQGGATACAHRTVRLLVRLACAAQVADSCHHWLHCRLQLRMVCVSAGHALSKALQTSLVAPLMAAAAAAATAAASAEAAAAGMTLAAYHGACVQLLYAVCGSSGSQLAAAAAAAGSVKQQAQQRDGRQVSESLALACRLQPHLLVACQTDGRANDDQAATNSSSSSSNSRSRLRHDTVTPLSHHRTLLPTHRTVYVCFTCICCLWLCMGYHKLAPSYLSTSAAHSANKLCCIADVPVPMQACCIHCFTHLSLCLSPLCRPFSLLPPCVCFCEMQVLAVRPCCMRCCLRVCPMVTCTAGRGLCTCWRLA